MKNFLPEDIKEFSILRTGKKTNVGRRSCEQLPDLLNSLNHFKNVFMSFFSFTRGPSVETDTCS